MDKEFTWIGGSKVTLTGNFDNWSKSLELTKNADGVFSVRLPKPVDLDKVVFKFVVDGEWLVSPDFPSEVDAEGNLNNVYVYPAEVSAVVKPLDRVPSIVLQTYENKDGKAALIKEEIITVPDVLAPLASKESEKTLTDNVQKASASDKQKKPSLWKSFKRMFTTKKETV